MVNVHIHQFKARGAAPDASALEQFQKQWATYQKLVDSDVLSHKAVGRLLHDALTDTFKAPFTFVDIACGDASLPKRALSDTKVSHYHGIDLSEPAIELAAANLKGAPFRVDLDHRDFVEALASRTARADIAWCSLSIHHLETDAKLSLMKEIHAATSRMLMIYEPTRLEGESRDAYLDRFVRVNKRAWTMLTATEWGEIEHHVRTADLPETPSMWLSLGRDAGFASAREVFDDPTNFYRVYRYER